jgi:hypothetical protein
LPPDKGADKTMESQILNHFKHEYKNLPLTDIPQVIMLTSPVSYILLQSLSHSVHMGIGSNVTISSSNRCLGLRQGKKEEIAAGSSGKPQTALKSMGILTMVSVVSSIPESENTVK